MGETNGDTPHKPKKVMVFCDGTWCGQLTGTQTNVKLLADAVAGTTVNARETFVSKRDSNIIGCYYDGEGVQGSFSDYLLDGALGGKIKEDCLGAYKFIMEEFEQTNGNCEAWLIGLSRGSYTVRCVAGLINNCGLISRRVVAHRLATQEHPTKQEMEDIISRAYDYYRDRSETYTPESPYMMQWKRDHSRVTERPPIKFMGLFETVGSLGIPSLNPGQGVDYYGTLNFYGKADEGSSAVSGEVERVYQALAVHDRLTAFNPCHVKRNKTNENFSYNKEKNLGIVYKTKELWFPGAHYDLGRQKFMFYKSPKLFTDDLRGMTMGEKVTELMKRAVERGVSFSLSRLLRIPDVHPNYDYSWAVLQWMTKKMSKTDRDSFGDLRDLLLDEKIEPEPWVQSLVNRLTFKPAPLSNDAYDNLIEKKYLSLELVPFANRFLVALFNRYLLKDRTILDPPPANPHAPPVLFYRAPEQPDDVNLRSSVDYRSRSYDSYKLESAVQHKEMVIKNKLTSSAHTQIECQNGYSFSA